MINLRFFHDLDLEVRVSPQWSTFKQPPEFLILYMTLHFLSLYSSKYTIQLYPTLLGHLLEGIYVTNWICTFSQKMMINCTVQCCDSLCTCRHGNRTKIWLMLFFRPCQQGSGNYLLREQRAGWVVNICVSLVKGTMSCDGFLKNRWKWTDLGPKKGRGNFLHFSEAPLEIPGEKCEIYADSLL